MSEEDDRHKRSTAQILRGAVASYGLVIVNTITALLITPWIIKELGTVSYGIYTLGMSLMGLFMFDFGLGQATARFLSRHLETSNTKAITTLYGVIARVYAGLTALLFIVLLGIFLSAETLYARLTAEEIEAFKVVFVLVGAYSLVALPLTPLNGAFIASEEFARLKVADIAQKLISTALIALALVCGWGLYAVVAANAIAGLGILAWKLYYFPSLLPVKLDLRKSSSTVAKQLFAFTAWLGLTGMCNLLAIGLAPTILGAFSGVEEVALFGVSRTLEGYIYMIAAALNGLFLPRVTRLLLHRNGPELVTNLMIQVGRIQLIIVGIIFMGFLLFGREFVSLWVGSTYTPSYLSALLLIAPSLVYLPQQLGRTAMVAAGFVREQAAVSLMMVLLSVALGIVLAPAFGAVGVSLAICIAYSGRNVGFNIVFRRKLGLEVGRFYRECFGPLAIPLLLIGGAGFAVGELAPGEGLVGLLLKLTIYCLIAGVTIWFAGLRTDEKTLLKSVLRRAR